MCVCGQFKRLRLGPRQSNLGVWGLRSLGLGLEVVVPGVV